MRKQENQELLTSVSIYTYRTVQLLRGSNATAPSLFWLLWNVKKNQVTNFEANATNWHLCTKWLCSNMMKCCDFCLQFD